MTTLEHLTFSPLDIVVPRFPSPFLLRPYTVLPTTLIELRMGYFSGIIRSKSQWWKKVFDRDIVSEWRAEVVAQDHLCINTLWGDEMANGSGEKQWPQAPITVAQLNYIFDELKYHATIRDQKTGIYATAIRKVYESRSLVAPEIKRDLVAGVSVLELVPDDEKDWHPGSNRQVLDLVHPSLYSLRINKSVSQSQGPATPPANTHSYFSLRPDLSGHETWAVSNRFQWLPTDFRVTEDGTAVHALGYINNLHPTRHAGLYPTISSLLTRFVPLFERVLSDLASVEPPPVINPDPETWYSHITAPEPDFSDEVAWGQWDSERWPFIPDPVPFKAANTPTAVHTSASPNTPEDAEDSGRVEVSLRGCTLQVIVKLANIVLTPENPRYPGGVWHVEGMANENIVATGLYYYACENITESRLAFRQNLCLDGDTLCPFPYEHNDMRGWHFAYGFAGEDQLNQRVGHIVAEEDKCVAFPNVYQHRVEAFELADPSRPGVRKILCFFLVNPDIRIQSTADVPPQQRDWVVEACENVKALERLPQELFDEIMDYTADWTMSRAEAEEERETLMAERAKVVVSQNEERFELEFNMCEH